MWPCHFLSDTEVRTCHMTLSLFVRLLSACHVTLSLYVRLWGKDWSRDPVTFASLLIFYVKNEVNFIFKSSSLWFHLPEEDIHQGSRLNRSCSKPHIGWRIGRGLLPIRASKTLETMKWFSGPALRVEFGTLRLPSVKSRKLRLFQSFSHDSDLWLESRLIRKTTDVSLNPYA